MSKLILVHVWSEVIAGDGVKVAEVYYSTGSCKRYYSSYSSEWPKSVHSFIDTHDPQRVNSQVTAYKSHEC